MYDTIGLWRTLWLSPRWQIRKEYLVLSKDLSSVDARPPADEARVPTRWATLTDGDISSLRAANPRLSETEMRRRWQEGQQCIGAFVGDGLVHYRWETDKRCYLPYLKKTFEPLEGDIFVSDAFTNPAFRGRGLHSLSTARTLACARQRGLRRSLTMLAWWNTVARRVILEKARREVMGHVGYWQLGLTTRHFATGKVRFGTSGEVYVVGSDPAPAAIR